MKEGGRGGKEEGSEGGMEGRREDRGLVLGFVLVVYSAGQMYCWLISLSVTVFI